MYLRNFGWTLIASNSDSISRANLGSGSQAIKRLTVEREIAFFAWSIFFDTTIISYNTIFGKAIVAHHACDRRAKAAKVPAMVILHSWPSKESGKARNRTALMQKKPFGPQKNLNWS
jgi:hypothetical protein